MKNYLSLLKAQAEKNAAPVAAWIINNLPEGTAYYFDETGNLFVTRGTGLQPCIVAHMDTVQTPDRLKMFRERNGKIYGLLHKQQTGIGADDKNGIYIALEAFKKTAKPLTLLFTHGEETGCIGATAVKGTDVKNIAYFLEFDRKGAGDIIDYGSKEFISEVSKIGKSYGYKTAPGLFTDVATLSRMQGISAVNLSCGYYNHHTPQEFTMWQELQNALQFCLALLEKLPLRKYQYEYTHPASYNYYGYTGKWSDRQPSKYSKYNYCDYCGQFTEIETIKGIGMICEDCKEEYKTSIEDLINTDPTDDELNYYNKLKDEDWY